MSYLYHYCSNSAFHSIVSNKSVWLSSLTLSNDSMEGKLVSTLIKEIAKEDGLNDSDILRLQESLSVIENMFDGLGFCLSSERDLLSQWRGYGEDATGVSIGFSMKYLERFSESTIGSDKSGFTLSRVEYDRDIQMKLLLPTYKKIKEFIDKGAYKSLGHRTSLDIRAEGEITEDNIKILKANENLILTALVLFKDLFLLKNKAFKEEQEWRLISYLTDTPTDTCLFRAGHDRIVPYREYILPSLDEKSITEVILGPKNKTPPKVIEIFMKKYGFLDVKVTSSEAPYQ